MTKNQKLWRNWNIYPSTNFFSSQGNGAILKWTLRNIPLPPNSATFWITEAGISDSETVVYPDGSESTPLPVVEIDKDPEEPLIVSAAASPIVEKPAQVAAGIGSEIRDPLEMVELRYRKAEDRPRKPKRRNTKYSYLIF